ncbi:surface-adhesin E family protein [Verminephrobacter aporrectodeae]|uniref:surface-adhesin E family protein n=1 Tax=Verminephrobacter aporrectodeae TaxID=1110389 RepID=UPI0022370BEA|nr:surface-adhesin E family protein [Verminephrobacter aporrectodeae]
MGKHLLAAIILSCTASVATAANWKLVSSWDKGMIYVDTVSIAKSPLGRKAWFWTELYSPQKGDHGKYFSSEVTLYHYDCQGRSSSIAKMVFYSGATQSGDIVYSWSKKSTKDGLEDIIPGTVGEELFDFVCSFKNFKR